LLKKKRKKPRFQATILPASSKEMRTAMRLKSVKPSHDDHEMNPKDKQEESKTVNHKISTRKKKKNSAS